MDGGAGIDTVSFEGSDAAIKIDIDENGNAVYDGTIGNGKLSGGHADGDQVIDIENITGSAFDDNITGNINANVLSGGDGADIIRGYDGDDTLIGGGGDDTLLGQDGNDLFIFQEGGGTDTAQGGAGGGWTDVVELQDATGGSNIGTYGVDWTLTVTEGSIQSQDANSITLSDDADGIITLQDGSTFNFQDFERIDW